jgi:hypothetical protein
MAEAAAQKSLPRCPAELRAANYPYSDRHGPIDSVHPKYDWSGRRDSNTRPSAPKADFGLSRKTLILKPFCFKLAEVLLKPVELCGAFGS